ncbi:DUF2752 domain-containing protein [Demequina activiva]|uniref:DUF2752 domain-containing protein n=1 Tax=Demequina activiva TaxID=1582364 RepID=A0A919Q3Y9_9MICO|nr:DUF2752 domain-containing protein [Demequina activiva]GIG54471.1 hypothetical protein Dac01nite_12230 [Demequina activiva]
MSLLERVESAQRTAASRLHPLVAPVAVAVATVAATAYVAQVDPHEGGHYPTCPSLWLTGWYCPGCGSLRAIHDMAHLDLAGAWGMNPLAVLVVPWLLWRWAAWTAAALGRPVRRRPAPAWSLYALAGAVVLYAVLRNIPALEPYLAP